MRFTQDRLPPRGPFNPSPTMMDFAMLDAFIERHPYSVVSCRKLVLREEHSA